MTNVLATPQRLSLTVVHTCIHTFNINYHGITELVYPKLYKLSIDVCKGTSSTVQYSINTTRTLQIQYKALKLYDELLINIILKTALLSHNHNHIFLHMTQCYIITISRQRQKLESK